MVKLCHFLAFSVLVSVAILRFLAFFETLFYNHNMKHIFTAEYLLILHETRENFLAFPFFSGFSLLCLIRIKNKNLCVDIIRENDYCSRKFEKKQ